MCLNDDEIDRLHLRCEEAEAQADQAGKRLKAAERQRDDALDLLAECVGPITAATPTHDGWGGEGRHPNLDLLDRIDTARKAR